MNGSSVDSGASGWVMVISGMSAMLGTLHGSAALPSAPSERRMTGHIARVARCTASIAISKQLPGLEAAITMTGHSPDLPNIACNKSACSDLVGMPVDGPARWMFRMTSGSSIITASPIASLFSARPGPDVPVTPICPAKEAPIAVITAAISSSA